MRIALIGAYGYTGQLICEELKSSGFKFSVYGRDFHKLIQLKNSNSFITHTLAIDIRQKEDVLQVLNANDIIINCAGPFTEESAVLLHQIVLLGKTYLDITGEVEFVKKSRELYHSIACTHNALVLHGNAFESLIADLGIQLLTKNKSPLRSIKTFYQFNQMKCSPGTRMTMKLSKFRDSLKIKNHNWVLDNKTESPQKLNLPKQDNYSAIAYPLPEIAYSFWNHHVKEAASYLILPHSEALFYSKSKKTGNPLSLLDEIRLRKKEGPRTEERKHQKSNVFIEVDYYNGKSNTLLLESVDMYLTTAKAVVLSLKEITNSKNNYSGVISPAELFKNQELRTLKNLSVTVNETSKITSL